MARPVQPPGGPFGGGFARPTLLPSRPALLARPNVGGPPALAGRHPGGWAPPVVNHGWARPAATLVTRRPYHWGGYYGGYPYHALYGQGSYYYYSYNPYYSNYYLSYGSNPYGDSDASSGSRSDPGASRFSDRPAQSPPARGEEGAADTDKETVEAERSMDLAREAFREGDYATSQEECERAVRRLPGDANLHEFRALCQFAQGQYKGASATLHEVLAAGPGWGWHTLSSFYPGARTYTTQLRALERYVRENPKDAAGHFVLAYHYLALDERDAAAGQLREVIKLRPGDRVSHGILEALEKAKKGKGEAPDGKPAPGGGTSPW